MKKSPTKHNIFLHITDSDNDFIAFSTDAELAEALQFVTDGMLRVYIRPDNTEAQSNAAFHPGVVCDGCQGPIYGSRFKCAVCPDFDLCTLCNEQGKHTEHAMMLLRTPEQRQHFDTFVGLI
jgi:sequestosome 1